MQVIWRAYELRPEPVPTLDPKGDYLERVWGSSVYPMARRLGMPIKLPPVQPRSRLAHEAAQWARSERRFDEYNAALFRAFFERGEDIGTPAVLTAVAADLGLDAHALQHALDAHSFEKSVLEEEHDAAALGISGVPAFVANRRTALSGVQTVDALRRLVEHVRA